MHLPKCPADLDLPYPLLSWNRIATLPTRLVFQGDSPRPVAEPVNGNSVAATAIANDQNESLGGWWLGRAPEHFGGRGLDQVARVSPAASKGPLGRPEAPAAAAQAPPPGSA